MGEVLPKVPAAQRFASQARLLRRLSGLTQIGLMVALFVMWKQYHVPFAKAFEQNVRTKDQFGATTEKELIHLIRSQPVAFQKVARQGARIGVIALETIG